MPWAWDVTFNRNFNDWEVVVLAFLNFLNSHEPGREGEDDLRWMRKCSGIFYFIFNNLGCPSQLARISTNPTGSVHHTLRSPYMDQGKSLAFHHEVWLLGIVCIQEVLNLRT
jgi:hypothetical protein